MTVIQNGDWIRFLKQDGANGPRLVIAIVEYLVTVDGRPVIVTNEGAITPDAIFEVRREAEEDENAPAREGMS